MVVLGCLLDFLNICEKHIHSSSVFTDELDKSRNVFKALSVESQQVSCNTIKDLYVAAGVLNVHFI